MTVRFLRSGSGIHPRQGSGGQVMLTLIPTLISTLSLTPGVGAVLAGTAHAQAAPAAASAPLALQVTCDASGHAPVLYVKLVNRSERATSVVVGFTAADGKTRVVDSLDVIAIRPATGADEVYVYVNPKYALVKGTPWIVTIAPGATHDLEVLLRDFISTMTYTGLDPTVAVGTRVIFEASAVAKTSTPVWTGRVETKIESCR